MVTNRARKVREIETARAFLIDRQAADVRGWAWAVIGPGSPTFVLREAVARLAGTIYKRDRYDAKRKGSEVVKHPLAIIRQRGGDCEDLNVFTLGAVLKSLGVGGLASIYLPSVERAAHVRLGVQVGGERWMGDLVEPAFVARWDGKGEWIAWNG